MSSSDSRLDGARALFEPERDHLRAIAYRMLGTVSDSEDIVQDAFLRFARVDAETVKHPRAYLSRLVTRLCVDHLRSARVRREAYVGPWLPEPLVQEGIASPTTAPDEAAALREDVSLALMVALERLSPLERAAFILHDVFDMDYDDVAEALGREPAACRQLAARGRKHVRENRPRFKATAEESQALLGAFAQAAMSGDVAHLKRHLAKKVTFTTDGGGKAAAATKVLVGPDQVATFIISVVQRFYSDGHADTRPATINGQPGFVVREKGQVTQAMAVSIEAGEIAAIYSVRNPDKLRHLNH